MKKLNRPIDRNGSHLDPGAVFDACLSGMRNAELKDKLTGIKPQVVSQSSIYSQKAGKAQLFQIKKTKNKHKHKRIVDEMIDIYTSGMAGRKDGRVFYDQIMAQVPEGLCPFCGIGVVTTLDHYLPKSRYPILSVTPDNLVPACLNCQKTKGEHYPKSAEEQILHPYFDDLDNDIWLKAKVVQESPAAFLFYSDPPASWTSTNKERLKMHLERLKLNFLFSKNAGGCLSNIRNRLIDLHKQEGLAGVKEYLQEELNSFEKVQKNSYKTAMYRAAIECDWFCDGGFQ